MNIPFELASGRKDFREAADAGLLLWRKNFISFMPFFAIPFWICAFALRLIPFPQFYWPWIIIWLLKPLFERPVLHILSVKFFEREADLGRLMRGFWKSLLRGLPGDLLWRRFSPLRSAMMPMRVLEQKPKSGGSVSRRKKLLKKGGVNYCFLLTLWGIAVEIAMFFGVLLFFYIMQDLVTEGAYSFFDEDFGNFEIYVYAIYCFNYMLIEPVYVCMGFSLYINSRIEVEGWDLEIIFRNFAEKLKEKSKSGALAVLFMLFLFLPLTTFADKGGALTSSDGVPLEQLQTILDSPELVGERDAWNIRLKNPVEMVEPSINFEGMERLREIIAFVLRFILVAAITFVLVFLFFYLRKFNIGRRGKDERPNVISLQKIYDENPKQLLEKAIGCHENGNTRLAWVYCTAAAILSWPFYRGLSFPQNATEGDCAEKVNSMAAAGIAFCNAKEARDFNSLINNWVYLAYAGQFPPTGSFENAIAFCKSLEAPNE